MVVASGGPPGLREHEVMLGEGQWVKASAVETQGFTEGTVLCLAAAKEAESTPAHLCAEPG